MMSKMQKMFSGFLGVQPSARALVMGSEEYSSINGDVWFYETKNGVVVVADIEGLPAGSGVCDSPVFAFHIHNGTSCTGNSEDAFFNAGTHYNPNGCLHPYHAGDLPPLFSANGNAFMAVLTNRFKVKDIIGRVIIIHSSVDDFTTQPSGNAGKKIACGKIVALTSNFAKVW